MKNYITLRINGVIRIIDASIVRTASYEYAGSFLGWYQLEVVYNNGNSRIFRPLSLIEAQNLIDQIYKYGK